MKENNSENIGKLSINVEKKFDWEEIKKHTSREDRWIVVDGCVVDVSKWARKHPGGEKIISGFAGQDASEAWHAFHIDKVTVSKYTKNFIIGKIEKQNVPNKHESEKEKILDDFQRIKSYAERESLYKPSILFYSLIMLHILFLDFLGWLTLYTFGTGWIPYIVAALILATAQIQAGWAQHDYGHLSVFNNYTLNHIVQIFLLNFIKGASSDWWNFRHLNHHAKPNALTKDPDITLAPLFLVGKKIANEYGENKKKILPYNWQHRYFFLTLPPLLLPLYFNIEIPYFLIKRRRWMELFWTGLFFIRWQIMYNSLLGFFGVFGLFLFVRIIESHWFVWATQMSHIPMHVDYDQNSDWVSSQLLASCNVESSPFNDWWSGHLNFQIEHHLFPTMPRHNLFKIAPKVRELCKKHNLNYQIKPLWKAFQDIISTLKVSGRIWEDAYRS